MPRNPRARATRAHIAASQGPTRGRELVMDDLGDDPEPCPSTTATEATIRSDEYARQWILEPPRPFRYTPDTVEVASPSPERPERLFDPATVRWTYAEAPTSPQEAPRTIRGIREQLRSARNNEPLITETLTQPDPNEAILSITLGHGNVLSITHNGVIMASATVPRSYHASDVLYRATVLRRRCAPLPSGTKKGDLRIIENKALEILQKAFSTSERY